MSVIERDGWGAQPPKHQHPRSLEAITVVHVHYSDGPVRGADTAPQQVRSIQKFHMGDKGWDDIGYHWLVDADGNIYKGRPIEVIGAETAGHNTESVGVCVLTDGPFAPKAQAGVMAVIALVEHRLGRKTAVRPHSADVATACPGDEIRAWIQRLDHDHPSGGNMPPTGDQIDDDWEGPDGEVVACVSAPGGGGWVILRDGAVFTVDPAPFYGSYPGLPDDQRQAAASFKGAVAGPDGGYILIHDVWNGGQDGLYHFGPPGSPAGAAAAAAAAELPDGVSVNP